MTCNLCYPACQCGAEAAVRERQAFQEKVREFLRARSPEVRAIETLLASYAAGC